MNEKNGDQIESEFYDKFQWISYNENYNFP